MFEDGRDNPEQIIDVDGNPIGKTELVEGNRLTWGPVLGAKLSSTRTELTARLGALQRKKGIHIGVDNQTVVTKFMQLVQAAREIGEGEHQALAEIWRIRVFKTLYQQIKT